MARWLQFALPTAVLLGAVALRAANPGPLELIELKVFDFYQQQNNQRYHSTIPGTDLPMPVKVVDLDDESLRRFGQWPWPRTLIAQLVQRLHQSGVATIAFDVVFAEPDRTSPSRVIELWPAGPAVETLRPQIADLPDHDDILAQVIGRAPVVTGFVLTAEPGGQAPAGKTGFATVGENPAAYAPLFNGAVTNLSGIEAAARGNGSVNIDPDDDQIIRRVPMVVRYGDTLYPSLVAEALRVGQGASSIVVKATGAGETSGGVRAGMTHVKIGALIVPTDRFGQLWIYHTGPEPKRVIPAWQVLTGAFDPAELRGKIVFIGASAAALNDLRPTPVHPATPGVEIHAQAAEQIISQIFLQRPDWAEGAELIGLLVIGMVLIFVVFRYGAAWGAALALAAIVGGGGQSWILFKDQGLLFSPLYPSMTIVMVFISASVTSYLQSEAGRRQVRTAFGRYMSPVLLDRLAQHRHELKLGGEMREMTLLFCDVRDFTALSERLDAQQLTNFVNRFLTPMTEAVHETGGMVDKYMGDCVMAFWNAPLDDPDHGRHACQTALSMLRRLDQLNLALEDMPVGKTNGEARETLRVGIGLSTGLCCVGNMGSEQRFDYSVVGDSVNLAARLEGLTKTYGVVTVISEATRLCALDLAALELDLVRVKGKAEPVRIFALLGDETLAQGDGFKALQEAHDLMLTAYRVQSWAIARDQLETVRDLAGGFGLDALYDLYEERIDTFLQAPPDKDWDGVYVALTK